MSIAFLFPGQASQYVGMGMELRKNSDAARRIFQAADRAVDFSVTAACASATMEELTETSLAQPAVVATDLAAHATLAEELSRRGINIAPLYSAGHSVGELAALAAAGAVSPDDALRLAAIRGRLMAEISREVDGCMAAVVGLEETDVNAICSRASAETGSCVQIANLNGAGQIVISGERSALMRAEALARSMGARRTVQLKVSGPFHSRYMRPAAERFAQLIASMCLHEPAFPVVLNLTARPCHDPAVIGEAMATQIYRPVRWEETIRFMQTEGCRIFVELGPGQVLSGLARRLVPEATVLHLEDQTSLHSTVEALCRLLANR